MLSNGSGLGYIEWVLEVVWVLMQSLEITKLVVCRVLAWPESSSIWVLYLEARLSCNIEPFSQLWTFQEIYHFWYGFLNVCLDCIVSNSFLMCSCNSLFCTFPWNLTISSGIFLLIPWVRLPQESRRQVCLIPICTDNKGLSTNWNLY